MENSNVHGRIERAMAVILLIYAYILSRYALKTESDGIGGEGEVPPSPLRSSPAAINEMIHAAFRQNALRRVCSYFFRKCSESAVPETKNSVFSPDINGAAGFCAFIGRFICIDKLFEAFFVSGMAPSKRFVKKNGR